MDGGQRYGRPDEELFMPPTSARPQTPNVGPLKFVKAATSPSPANGVNVYPGPYDPDAPEPAPISRSANILPYPDSPPFRPAVVSNPAHVAAIFSNAPQVFGDAQQPTGNSNVQNTSTSRFQEYDRGTSFDERYSEATLRGDIASSAQQSYWVGEDRIATPKPLPASPGPEIPEKDTSFVRPIQRARESPPQALKTGPSAATQRQFYAYNDDQKQYHASPAGVGSRSTAAPSANLSLPDPQGVSRLASTSSVSTTKAARGSPPPPETPTDVPDIQARFLASGIAGPSIISNLQAQSLRDVQQVDQQQVQRSPLSRPLHQRLSPEEAVTPSVDQDGLDSVVSEEHVQIPRVYGQGEPSADGIAFSPQRRNDHTGIERPMNQDMQRLNIGEEPPPAYAIVTHPGQARPLEKANPNVNGRPHNNSLGQSANVQNHPAFANVAISQPSIASPTPSNQHQDGHVPATPIAPVTSPAPIRATPPPLPEGWISHLDPKSGHYYYIHLPTQSTQWEFPKGPLPLSMNEPPLSPTGTLVNNPLSSPSASNFGGKPLASPGFGPQSSHYAESMYSMGLSSPTAAGFTGPPPSSGVEMYRVAPTNGVYFGPYLRYTNMDVDNGVWYGSVMLVTDTPHPPTIHLHQSTDLSPNPRQLKAKSIWQHQRWVFYRYDIDIRMEQDYDAKWTYAITSHLGCTRFEFLVAGRHETSWRFIAHSGNDFAINVSANERARLGGVGYMWKDVMQKHYEVGGFHAQLGMGNQIYADRLWKEIPSLRQWTAMSGKENRKGFPWTKHHEAEVAHAYFHYYTSHFDQPQLREAFAQIPHVLTLDDHDIFDGYGSYPEHMQASHMFKNIGRVGLEAYLLFQHHTTPEILGSVRNDFDLFTITGNGWHFLKYLGPAVVVVGMDSRSERTPNAVMAGPTYQGLFPKVAILPPHVQHCVWMISVPLMYPRLDIAEQIANTMATGKRAVTGTYNALSKVTSSVAGVVGAKGVVGEGFASVKKAVGKTGLMSNMLSPFGELDILDELRDQWTHESKDLERTYLIRTLQGIAYNKSLRMTIFSGSTNTCGAGLVHDPSKPSDHKTMYQVITSSIVNAPPAPYVLRLLQPSATNGGKPLYVPMNGHRSQAGHASDTKEDSLEIFGQDVNGAPRDTKRLMGRRNYVAVVAYDPEVVKGAFGQTVVGKEGKGPGRLSLAVDFMVQGDGAGTNGPGATVKYGPLIIPSLEYGR